MVQAPSRRNVDFTEACEARAALAEDHAAQLDRRVRASHGPAAGAALGFSAGRIGTIGKGALRAAGRLVDELLSRHEAYGLGLT